MMMILRLISTRLLGNYTLFLQLFLRSTVFDFSSRSVGWVIWGFRLGGLAGWWIYEDQQCFGWLLESL
jgi:hypothetical protein